MNEAQFMNRIPQIGERWKYRDEFILEIETIQPGWSGTHFQGTIIQVLSGAYRQLGPQGWHATGKSGGYTEYMENWTLLEGQNRPEN